MAISQKIIVAEFWFLCTTLPHHVSYQCFKFQVAFTLWKLWPGQKFEAKINERQKLKKPIIANALDSRPVQIESI